MRLIDADAFFEVNKDIIDNNIDTNRYEVTLRELINEAPTVEINTNDIEYKAYCRGLDDGMIMGTYSARPHGEWISCSERLPEDLEPVNITWVNHEPEPYYHDIKDKNFVATGIHYRGQWYWYSTTCADYLGEYGSNDIDLVDDAIEIVAWMPLPKPYKEEGEAE